MKVQSFRVEDRRGAVAEVGCDRLARISGEIEASATIGRVA